MSPAPDLTDRHPGTQHALTLLTPNTRLDGIALDVSVAFWNHACAMVEILRDGPELTAGLRSLWEAKNCMVFQGLQDCGKVG
jgi:hypothetical protein